MPILKEIGKFNFRRSLKMKRLILGLLALMLIFGFSGCSENKNLNGLISHFKENNIDIKPTKKHIDFLSVGAINGKRVANKNYSVLLTLGEWSDSESVKMTQYKNGKFGMVILYPDNPESKLYKKVVETFKDY
jgi:hypothetical protein